MLPRRHCSPICMINDRFSLKVNSIRITSATKANLGLGHVLFFPLYNGNFSNKISLCFFPGKICTYFVIMPSTGRIFCLVLDEQAFSWACHDGTVTHGGLYRWSENSLPIFLFQKLKEILTWYSRTILKASKN